MDTVKIKEGSRKAGDIVEVEGDRGFGKYKVKLLKRRQDLDNNNNLEWHFTIYEAEVIELVDDKYKLQIGYKLFVNVHPAFSAHIDPFAEDN